jgi:hypothetical protein
VIETVVERLERGIDEFEHPDWGEDGYA